MAFVRRHPPQVHILNGAAGRPVPLVMQECRGDQDFRRVRGHQLAESRVMTQLLDVPQARL